MITIRQADEFDIISIFHIEINCFVPGIRAETDEIFKQQLSNYPKGMMVVEIDGFVVGYIMGELIPQDWDLRKQHYFSQTGQCLYVTSFAILPEHQKNGIGKKLFFDFIKTFPNTKVIGVVNPKWKEVHNFYKRIGFVDIKELSNFFHPYGQHESGIVAELNYRLPGAIYSS